MNFLIQKIDILVQLSIEILQDNNRMVSLFYNKISGKVVIVRGNKNYKEPYWDKICVVYRGPKISRQSVKKQILSSLT